MFYEPQIIKKKKKQKKKYKKQNSEKYFSTKRALIKVLRILDTDTVTQKLQALLFWKFYLRWRNVG